jgi:hypothetical protein
MKHESETWSEYIPAALVRGLLSFCGIFILPKTGLLGAFKELAIIWSLFFGAIMIIATYNSH